MYSCLGRDFLFNVVSASVKVVGLPEKKLLFDLNGRGLHRFHAEFIFHGAVPVHIVLKVW